MTGILLVDKPSGMTSHDVVDYVRKKAQIRRVGHTGTLDPAATGLLILCLGKATRLSEHLTGLDKVYEGDMRLGVVTDSYDRDGEVLEEHPVPALTEVDVSEAFEKYTGDILQVPPMVSAVKIGGERLYKKARKGETIEREPRKVRIKELTLLNFDPPLIHFRIACSRGTYVRSICHDIGHDLGCGAILESLRRTQVGPHSVDEAHTLEELGDEVAVEQALVPLEDALDLPRVTVRRGSESLVASGGTLMPKDLLGECPVQEGWVQLQADTGELLALAQVEMSPAAVRIQPRRVFAGAS